MQTKLETQIQSFFRPFIQLSTLSGAEFPLFPTTYSLWRKVCYKNITSKYRPQPNSVEEKNIKRAFIKVSQRKLLPQFISKVKKQIDGKSVGWRKAILSAENLKIIDSEQYQELLFSYCEALYQLQLWIEMFYDLVSIPYSEVYQENKQYLTSQKFKATIYSQKSETFMDKACNKLGKNIVSKGLGKISQKLLSNRIIYGMTGVLGAFNPLATVASLSISYAMQTHEKYSKVNSLVSQLEYLKNETLKNIAQLKETYEMCLGSIDVMAQLQIEESKQLEKEKRKFQQLLGTVLEEDWLEIKSTMIEGEWELVQLKTKYSVDDQFPIITNLMKENHQQES